VVDARRDPTLVAFPHWSGGKENANAHAVNASTLGLYFIIGAYISFCNKVFVSGYKLTQKIPHLRKSRPLLFEFG